MSQPNSNPDSRSNPLAHPDEWDDFVRDRYGVQAEPNATAAFQATNPSKKRNDFRDYDANARPTVREFYRLNHRYQTVEFGRQKRREYVGTSRVEMGIWEAAEFLNTLVDDSDPDTDLSQLQHLLQTSEQIRADGHPDWFVLAGFMHDLGKVLCLWGEPQWAVVGDTFPTGCRYSPKIVFSEFFAENPDADEPRYQTELGIYAANCGLHEVQMSWGHDEYIYQVARAFLPEEALYMLRYHSFYAWHREGEYDYLTDAKDREMFRWVQAFNEYDLYTKSHQPPDVEALQPYYTELIAKYFPPRIRW